jgi:hypothetical protein
MYQDNLLQTLAITAAQGKLQTCQNVLSVTTALSNGLSTQSYALPTGTKAVRLYPTAAVRYAIGEMPVMTTATFVAGATANASEWKTIYIDPSVSTTLQAVTAATCTLTVEAIS